MTYAVFQELSGLITCQIEQAEHMNMTVKIDCIDDDAIMDAGPAHNLIPWCSALDTDQG